MARPDTLDITEDAYARLEPVAATDEANGWHLLIFLQAIGEMFRKVEELVRATDGYDARSQILDVDRAPDWWLPNLAQFVGVSLIAGSTPTEQRERIKSTDGFKRGTVAALQASVAATLTGTRYVGVVERAGGDPYALQISTRAPETPNAAATLAAAMAQKPAGLILTQTVIAGITWGEMETRNPTSTWLQVEAQFATYADAEAVA
jgi:hypothetical protein